MHSACVRSTDENGMNLIASISPFPHLCVGSHDYVVDYYLRHMTIEGKTEICQGGRENVEKGGKLVKTTTGRKR